SEEYPKQGEAAASKESQQQGGTPSSKKSQKQGGTAGFKGSSQSGASQNFLPIITAININPNEFAPGKKYEVTAEAGDPDGDPLTYKWSGDGTFSNTKGNPTNWTAPDIAGEYKIKVTVKDGRGGVATRSKTITVTASLAPPPTLP
ncbi:MAG: PKD domain-containing protein, partial [Firmicutes bacterium]|nr:PKD domain-containing protein [Bacillota bacterium]